MPGLSKHEVCRIMRQGNENGFNLLQEVSFTVDRAIHQRVSIVKDDGTFESLDGWRRLKNLHGLELLWDDIDNLHISVAMKQRDGWQAIWGAGYGPEPAISDYLMSVEW